MTEWNEKMRIRSLRVHPEVFEAYVEVYRAARIMTQKMDEVLDHHEHRELINNGLSSGYKVPDVEAVRARNAVIKMYLDGIDPYNGALKHRGVIEFPARTARQLHLVAHHSTFMICDVINNINQSDYMKLFRNLKEKGGAYTGPTSLQEVFNVWGALINSNTRETRHVDQSRRLPSNWIRLVV